MIPRQLIFSSLMDLDDRLRAVPAFISSTADFLFLKDVARVALPVD